MDKQTDNTDSECESIDQEVLTDVSNVPLITSLELTVKETYHYKIIDKFYKTLSLSNVQLLVSIIRCESCVTLRLLDWFITKYSYTHTIRFKKNENDNDIDNLFNVHISYKAQLKSYKKKYFDPFRRRKRLRFMYYFDTGKQISECTTIGQLNFFKWLFSNNIMKYVCSNFKTLSKEMTTYNKMEKIKKKTKSSTGTGASIGTSVGTKTTDTTSEKTPKSFDISFD